MADWTSVGGDPAPGSPEAIRTVAGLWATAATTTTDQGSQLHGQASSLSSVWRDGDDAAAYEGLLRGPIPMLDALAAAHAASAGALLTYAQALEDAQQRGRTVLANANAAAAALSAAKSRAAAHAATAATSGSPAPGPFGSAFTSTPGPGELTQQQGDAADVARHGADLSGQALVATQIAAEVSQAARTAAAVLTQSADVLQTWHAGGGRTAQTPAEGEMAGSAKWRSRTVTFDDYAANHPLTMPCTPADVTAQWNLLDPALKAAYIERNPDLVGNTDGIPTVDRDAANRLVLTAMKGELQGRIAALGPKPPPVPMDPPEPSGPGNPYGPGTAWDRDHQITDNSAAVTWQADHDSMQNELTGLQNIQARIDGGTVPPAFLMGLNRKGTGQAIIASGDPDTATDVATYVPGTGTNVGTVTGDVDRADKMYVSAQRSAPGRTTSVITWLGYEAPPTLPDATYAKYADAAQVPLTSFLVGLRATHLGPRAHNTVLGHSYGATLVSKAAAKRQLEADDLIFIASPGADVPTAKDLTLAGVPKDAMPDHVYATATTADLVADTPSFIWPDDPTRSDFGARVFHSNAHRSILFWRLSDHSTYWDRDSPSLQAFAQIIAGNGNQVSH